MFKHLKGFPDLPPIWMLVCLIASVLLGAYLPLLAFHSVFLDGVGLTLIAAGLGLILWSAFWFQRKKTRIEPKHIPTALIVEGPYRLSRNPIYLGMAVIIIGVAMRSGGLTAFIPALLFPPLITKRFITGEETLLHDAFKSEAKRYLSATGRWLWFIK